MARIRGNTVILKGDPLQDTSRVQAEIDSTSDPVIAANQSNIKIYPGMLISHALKVAAGAAVGKDAGDVAHAHAEGFWTGAVADFRDYVGDGLSIPYEGGDTMQVFYPYSGCVLRGLVDKAGANLSIGDQLVSNGDGSLKKAVGTTLGTAADIKKAFYVVGFAMEIVDVSELDTVVVIGGKNYGYIQWRVK